MKEKLMDVLSNPLNEVGVKIYDISFEKEDVKKINPYFGICNICRMSRVRRKEYCGRDSEWEHTS